MEKIAMELEEKRKEEEEKEKQRKQVQRSWHTNYMSYIRYM